MSIPFKSLALAACAAILAVVLSMAVASVVMPVASADAAKLTACVNKKTGNMKMRFGKKAKKKCPKGWKKVVWNDSKSGALPSVYSADNRLVGKFLGSGALFAPWPFFTVERGGGQYIYEAGTGALLGLGSPDFTTADCAGPAYVTLTSPTPVPQGVVDRYVSALRGSTRITFRTEDPLGNIGVPRAWTGDGTSQAVGAPIATYDLDSETGACEVDAPAFTGSLLGLKSVAIPTPYDFTGPLTIR